MGLIGELVRQGVKLLVSDVQKMRCMLRLHLRADGYRSCPVDTSQATVISCAESRAFLARLGVSGEIVHTPSHSADSVSLVLDDGDCFVGDLEPYAYIDAYEDNAQLKADWARILAFQPKRIFFAHAPERILN